MTLAIVNVFPDPVTPRSVCAGKPSLIPCVSSAIASGWSPVGLNGETILNSIVLRVFKIQRYENSLSLHAVFAIIAHTKEMNK